MRHLREIARYSGIEAIELEVQKSFLLALSKVIYLTLICSLQLLCKSSCLKKKVNFCVLTVGMNYKRGYCIA